MKEKHYGDKNQNRERGSRPLLVIGIILLNISLFLAAFVLAFTLIVNPIAERDAQVRTLTEENTKLKNDAQLLQDQLDVVESELDTYKKQSGRSTSSSSARTSSDDEDGDDDYEIGSNSVSSTRNGGEIETRASSSRSRDDEMNMDE